MHTYIQVYTDINNHRVTLHSSLVKVKIKTRDILKKYFSFLKDVSITGGIAQLLHI
jgi:hypothetical protein